MKKGWIIALVFLAIAGISTALYFIIVIPEKKKKMIDEMVSDLGTGPVRKEFEEMFNKMSYRKVKKIYGYYMKDDIAAIRYELGSYYGLLYG